MATIEIPIKGMQPGETYDKSFQMTPINGFKKGGQLRLLLTLIDPKIHDRAPIFPNVLEQIYQQPLFFAPSVDEIEYVCPKALISTPKNKGAKKEEQTPGTPKVKKSQKENASAKEKPSQKHAKILKPIMPELGFGITQMLQTPASQSSMEPNSTDVKHPRQVIIKRVKTAKAAALDG